MERRQDWPERLAEVLDAARDGRWDSEDAYPCGYFAADCVRAMTGEDPAPGREPSVTQAYLRMRRDGYETLRDAVAAVLQEIPLAQAARGDIVVAVVGDQQALGVCVGEQCAFVAQGGGLAFRPTLGQAAAFRVPFAE